MGAYDRYLSKLTAAEAGFNSLTFEQGAKWYLQFIKQYPDTQNDLNALINDNNVRVSIESLISKFSLYTFTTKQYRDLLRFAREERLDARSFSDYCQHLGSINEVLANLPGLGAQRKAAIQQQFSLLPLKKLMVLIDLMSFYQEEINTNPFILDALMQFGESPQITPSRLSLLAQLFFKVAGKEKHAAVEIAHLQQSVARFIDAGKNDNELKQLLDLMARNTENREELLHDNVAHYLQNSIADGERNEAKAVVDLFYRYAKQTHGNVELIIDKKNKEISEMFNFANQNQAMSDRRIIWMHLLNHHAFVSTNDRSAQQDSHHYQWDIAKNQQLLQLGFDKYIAHTAKILKSKPAANVAVNRDLTIKQQHALLLLSDELSLIGKPNLALQERHLPLQTPEKLKNMEKDIVTLMGNYASSKFKSDERKGQFAFLQINIAGIMQNTNHSLDEKSRYEQVFLAINEARLQAIDDDLEQNKKRYFKLNRSGQSRYLNTLNQMQDMIVRHWVNDTNAIQGLSMYTTHSKREFFELVRGLHRELINIEGENHLTSADLKGMRKVTHFFTSNASKKLHTTLLDDLGSFMTDNNAENIDKQDLARILNEFRNNLSKVPGHLATLTQEVLGRGEALASYLEQEHGQSASRVFA